MKRFVGLMMIAVAFFATANDALAQDDLYMRVPHRFTISLDAGIGIPASPGNFKQLWNTGFPLSIGVGYSVFGWFEVAGMFTQVNFGNNALETKPEIGYVGTQDVEGGTISTKMFWGNARFIAVPSQRANPFAEVGVGTFKTSAEDIVIEGILVNPMESVSGITANFAIGIQYAMNAAWTSYTKYYWTLNQTSDFIPGNLLRGPGDSEITEGSNQQFSSLIVGLMIKF